MVVDWKPEFICILYINYKTSRRNQICKMNESMKIKKKSLLVQLSSMWTKCSVFFFSKYFFPFGFYPSASERMYSWLSGLYSSFFFVRPQIPLVGWTVTIGSQLNLYSRFNWCANIYIGIVCCFISVDPTKKKFWLFLNFFYSIIFRCWPFSIGYSSDWHYPLRVLFF